MGARSSILCEADAPQEEVNPRRAYRLRLGERRASQRACLPALAAAVFGPSQRFVVSHGRMKRQISVVCSCVVLPPFNPQMLIVLLAAGHIYKIAATLDPPE